MPARRSLAPLPVPLPCACATLRRAERAVTHVYDQALRPAGLRITQFTLLQALERAPGISQKKLGALLEMDSTTLTRTLALLREQDWVHSLPGDDRRELRLSLTKAGLHKLHTATARWQRAQARLRKAIGKDWLRTQATLEALTQAARSLR